MRYDFDTVIDRSNDSHSYSIKWRGTGPMAETTKFLYGYNELTDDRLCFFTADMDFKCPPEMIESLKKTVEHGIFGYSTAPERYFDAVCRWFRDRFDWEINPKNIFIGAAGTHDLIAKCIECYTQPQDGIIVLTPSYGYHGDIESNGRHMVAVPLINTDGYYTIDFDAFEKACAVKENSLFIAMQPHNPTGRIFTVEEIKKLGEICRKHNVIILSDEVHIDLPRHGNKIEPFMKVLGPQGVISATAVNKTFNVAGLAMSNLIIEDPRLKPKYKYGFVMPTPFGITAVISAYTECDDWVDQLNEYLDKIIDYTAYRLRKDLPKVKFAMPEATYVLWVDFSDYGLSDDELSARIQSTNVIIGDGVPFDEPEGKGRQFRRFCLTAPMVQIEEMCDRLAKSFEDLK